MTNQKIPPSLRNGLDARARRWMGAFSVRRSTLFFDVADRIIVDSERTLISFKAPEGMFRTEGDMLEVYMTGIFLTSSTVNYRVRFDGVDVAYAVPFGTTAEYALRLRIFSVKISGELYVYGCSETIGAGAAFYALSTPLTLPVAEVTVVAFTNGPGESGVARLKRVTYEPRFAL